jgi:ligand-binding sensor domain-containing protein
MGKNWFLYGLFLLPLWAAAQPHSISFHTININEGLSQSSVVDILTDPSGFIWLATQDGLNRYDGKEFVVVRRNFDDITTPTGSRLGKIISGSGLRLWLLTSGRRLERMDLLTGSITPLTHIGKDTIPLPPVSCFLEDSDGNWWIGTQDEGLFYYNPATRELKHYEQASPAALYLPVTRYTLFLRTAKNNIGYLPTKGSCLFG